MNVSPSYAEVVTADGVGKQIVPAGQPVRVVAARIEGSSGNVLRLRKTQSGGALLDTLVCPVPGAGNRTGLEGYLVESNDGLYAQRTGFTKARIWYVTAESA